MNRPFTIDVRGFDEKAEAALERMVADFIAGLPDRLKMDGAALVVQKQPPKPKKAKK